MQVRLQGKADAGNPDKDLEGCSSYIASNLRNGYAAASSHSGKSLLRNIINWKGRKSLSNRFGIKSQNKDLGWNQTAMLYETFFSFSEEQLPFQPHVKCF